jgi:hypothetical protein
MVIFDTVWIERPKTRFWTAKTTALGCVQDRNLQAEGGRRWSKSRLKRVFHLEYKFVSTTQSSVSTGGHAVHVEILAELQ